MTALWGALRDASAWGPLAALGAGLLTSAGPCVAPRWIAMSSMAASVDAGVRWKMLAAFIAGNCAVFIALGTIAGGIGAVAAASPFIDAAVAAAAIAAGTYTILRSAHVPACAHAGIRKGRTTLSGALLGGMAFGAVGGPCCGPVATVLAGVGVAGGSAGYSTALLGAYALGHCAPLVALHVGARFLQRLAIPTASVQTVSGALMLGLGAYFACLA